MRPLAAAAVLMTLLLAATPLALAESGKGRERAEEARLESGEHRRHDGSDERRHDDNETKGNRSGKAEARAGFLESFRAKLASWREAWKENATAIRETCHAVAPDRENATKEEHGEWAHCIRDGYRGFWQALRAERRAWHDEWKAAHD